VWAIIGTALLNMLALLPHPPGVTLVLGWLQPGAYIIVASATAAAARERHDLIILILLIAMLAAYPFDLQEVARLLMPLGLGILLGSILRTTIQQEPPERPYERAPR
jgi:hypothetical protein